MNNNGLVIWINGLSGSGKSTIGSTLYNIIKNDISNVVYLDGDSFREIFGQSKYDKDSRIQAAFLRAKLCELLSKQGIVVIASTISLFNEVYAFNKQIFKHYIEIYIECSMEELIKRDQKGLYTNALSGKIKDVVGIDIDYDMPNPDLIIDNNKQDNLIAKARQIIEYMNQNNIKYIK
ncbi:adenylyl-sulfate kinase [Helicobacter sp. 16-1353]|uniref:adenylyl-sulfate kinase n=1 Tax=Helicobacter sp. 16-1353 TaxID=2004996 RepID=UPI000DCC354F|nr:adenylyl-sulfate kinase [Helicobacter sp. 16-1353]RAX51929.1 adenylyl-sulfate kinase [Helicobacter sp. 16-1353]